MSTHNLCFEAKNKKNQVYPCIPQFCYIKMGYKGEYITQTCYPDVRKIELGCCYGISHPSDKYIPLCACLRYFCLSISRFQPSQNVNHNS